MPQFTKEKLLAYAKSTLSQSEHANRFFGTTGYATMASAVLANVTHLLHLLGKHGEHWKPLVASANGYHLTGVLHSVIQAIQGDMLITVEDLVVAEIHSDLLEQAEYLLGQGYYLAAGVIGRAVLEEHLRKWCQHANCVPPIKQPTLAHYNTELYGKQVINKITLKQLEALIAVGNDAAHNAPTLKRSDVERFIPEVREFLEKHPVS